MDLARYWTGIALALLLTPFAPLTGLAQSSGSIVGTVTLADSGQPLHNASVVILRLRQSVETDAEGRFRLDGVPPGTYDVLAHMDRFPNVVQRVTVAASGVATIDFAMSLDVISEEVTVTASGREQNVLDAFQSVTTLNSIELTQKAAPGLGEVLENEPGVAKRSFGPGSARPVIRGFDGDRVLVLQDGIRTGALSSQSGDHGEQVDVLSLDKIEIVKGPATLLYGSNAIGGVVNVVTGHNQVHDHPHEGLRGFLNATAGSANALGGASGGFEYGHENFLFWGNGGGLRTGDYETPAGRIENSQSRSGNMGAGLGYFGDRTFASFGYEYNNSRYGVPFAADFEAHGGEESEHEGDEELIELALERHNYRFTTGMRDLDAFVSNFRVTLTYTDYRHQEIEGTEVGTTFDNDQIVYRAQFDQRPVGPLTGSFGVWGMHRDFETVGAEALAPPVTQNAFAAFALEELDFEWARFQLGGRVERNSYDPDGLRARSFTGFSGAAGVHVPLWQGGAFVTNFTSSYRAPALEELYNFGPHVGNLTFEIGNPDLERERSNGLDVSLRHESSRLRGQINFFRYAIDDFVYLAPTGAIEDGLTEATYLQGDARFVGTEVDLSVALHRDLWLNLGFDSVDARLVAGDVDLPRIPPIRGRVGLDWTWNGLSVKPSVTVVDAQEDIFPTETRTAGYALFNVDASYTIAQTHVAHIFSVTAFNLGDRLYRNHLSFIKDLAPEIGRGVRVGYSLRFF